MADKVHVYDSFEFFEKWKFLIPTTAHSEFRDDLEEISRQSFAEGEMYADAQNEWK